MYRLAVCGPYTTSTRSQSGAAVCSAQARAVAATSSSEEAPVTRTRFGRLTSPK